MITNQYPESIRTAADAMQAIVCMIAALPIGYIRAVDMHIINSMGITKQVLTFEEDAYKRLSLRMHVEQLVINASHRGARTCYEHLYDVIHDVVPGELVLTYSYDDGFVELDKLMPKDCGLVEQTL
jgi:hypothetical protein